MNTVEKHTLLTYLQTELSVNAPLTLEPLIGGVSNLTYRLSDGQQYWIIRTSPSGTKAKGAHDMVREYQILKALKPDYPLSPQALLLIDDSAVFSRPLYAMEAKEGIAIQHKLPSQYSEDQLPLLGQSVIEAQYRLHQVPMTTTLAAFNKGRGYIERQVKGWIMRLQNVLPDHGSAKIISHWLVRQQPSDKRDYVLIHNDFKFDNLLFNKDKPTEVTAVLDWEMATVGDPLMDLGCSLAYWFTAEDAPAIKHISTQPTTHKGMLSRDEYVDYYCRLSGVDLDNYDFYYVFGLYRLIVIVQQIYFRNQQSQNPNPRFEPFGQIRDLLITHTLDIIGDKNV